MFQKLRNHFIIGFIFLILTLIQQYGFYWLKGLPIVGLPLEKYFLLFIFFGLITLTPQVRIRFALLSFFLVLNFFQMAHLSYFGTLILPSEIYLLFAEFHEITGTLVAELSHIIVPLLFTLIPLALGFFALKKFQPHYKIKWIPILIALYFIYNPVRTAITGNTWGRQPSTRELAGMNLYLALSYFSGRILPAKLSKAQSGPVENQSLKLKLEAKNKSAWDNIIVVLGESQSPDHMSLFGYERPTTPFLENLKSSASFHAMKGLSSGVSTDISVAFFLNVTYGEAGVIKAAKGEHCLFKLAKDQGFSTHFLSAQSSQQLRYITPYLCSASLDDFRSLEEVSPETQNANAAIDRHLLPKLTELLGKKSKNFIMLHQRGSHGPWELRSTAESKKFLEASKDHRINDYDNSVVEFDLFWKDLHQLLSQQTSKTLVLYLSDHGEAAGRNQKFGHGFLAPSSFEIPFFFFSFNQHLPEKTKELPKFLPQYNFSLYLIEQMGWKTNHRPHEPIDDFMIFGNDIDGFAGKMKIKFSSPGEYVYTPES
jgi:glucan phosphoethanolaminetransferase (alkaline phosphatase superfamily)